MTFHHWDLLIKLLLVSGKNQRVVFSKQVDQTLKNICLEIEKRNEVFFLAIGTDKDHVHFLLQSVPSKSPTQIIKMLKSITAREIFSHHPEVKKQLWGSEFWTGGYYVSTVGKHADAETI